MKFNVVLVGAGTWGQKYVSTLNSVGITPVLAYRHNWKSLIGQKPDGVIVCTPPQSHMEIASYALQKDIPVMIEKPLALSLTDAKVLEQYNATILVNHSHLFSNRYQKIKKALLPSEIKYIKTSGQGKSLERNYSELWDYGPHDLAMILDLAQQVPTNIVCQELVPRRHLINLQFDHFSSESVIGYNASGKIRYLEANDYRYDDTYDENDRTLTNALKVFLDAIDGKPDYRLGLDLPIKVMWVLEKCQECLNKMIY